MVHEVLHEQLLKLIRQYMLLGGMPKVIDTILNTRNVSHAQKIETEV